MPFASLNHHIDITPGIAGGKPRIVGHRITVQDIVICHELRRQTADDIASEYDLTLADVYAALTYYFDNRAEIDQSMAADEAFLESLRVTAESKLGLRMSQRQRSVE